MLVNKPLQDIITFTRASAATRINSAGVMESVAANVPRIDYYPITLAVNGLLIEEQRTNLLTYSADISNAAYSRQLSGSATMTVTPNYATAPDGSMTATRIQASLNGGVTTADFVQVFRAVSPAVQTNSIYAKSLSGSPRLSMSGFDSIVNNVTLDNSWKRISCVDAAGTSAQIRNLMLRGGQNPAHSDTIDILVWGAQLEVGSFATSYIPTTAAQATRAADVASINSLSSWFKPGGWTVFVEWTPNAFGPNRFRRVLEFGRVDASGVYICMPSNSDGSGAFVGAEGSGISLYDSVNVQAPGVTRKAVLACAPNDSVLSTNSTRFDTTFTLPEINRLFIGSSRVGSEFLQGHIRKIRYYSERVTNTDIEFLAINGRLPGETA